MPKKDIDLEKVISEKDQYDKESQNIIESLFFSRKEIATLNSMKRTEGWRILEQKIQEELQTRIQELVKEDLKVQTLLSLLKVADTKNRTKILQREIEKLFPE